MSQASQIEPPKWPLKFLRFFLRGEFLEEIEGDMEEIFLENLEFHSPAKASRMYTWDTLRLLRPILIRQLHAHNPIITYSMFQHNLTIAFRNFMRYKTSFLINLIGLASGLACFLLIYLWVQDEWKMDKGYDQIDQIYQVMEHVEISSGIGTASNTAGPMAEGLVDDFPEVEIGATARTKSINPNTLSFGDKNVKAKGLYASKDFFSLFSFSLLEGTPDQVLQDPSSIILSESLARSLFGNEREIIGKQVLLQREHPLQVSGILKDLDRHTSLQFDYVLSFEAWAEDNTWVQAWQNRHPQAFVRFQKGTDVDAFNEKIYDYLTVKGGEEEAHRKVELVPYKSSYLYGRYENGQQSGGRIEYVWLFSLVAIFILLIACINFMNLSTAKATQRTKEVGIKKSFGVRRESLVFQYMSESILLTFFSLVAAILLVVLLLPQFNHITGKQLELIWDGNLFLVLGGILVFTGLLAGSYPALYLSSLSPITIFRGKLSRSLGELIVRRGLVVLQYALSIILMVSVWVVYKQIEFTQTQNLGYNRENVILFNKEGKTYDLATARTLMQEFMRLPGVKDASIIGNTMTESDWGTNGIHWPGKDPDDRTGFDVIQVDYGTLEMLEIEMKEGRSFSEDYGSDSAKVIFNEAAIKHMGLENPVGQLIQWGPDYEIIGVAKNFHLESFHDEISPLIFYLDPNAQYMMAKIEGANIQETLSKMEEIYVNINPGFFLDYSFVDDDYAALYAAEQRVSVLSRYFAGLAILISCLGLFGLAMFTATKRRKEIGIRKVLGASSFQLIRLLSHEYSRMVGLAIIVALPVSYFLAQQWLETFVFRISLQWWYFLGVGVLAMLIAWLTVGLQTANATRINPVECLRDE
ncbi:MAG: ABC transporter permease [Bacteroidota bacterium]